MSYERWSCNEFCGRYTLEIGNLWLFQASNPGGQSFARSFIVGYCRFRKMESMGGVSWNDGGVRTMEVNEG